MPAAESGMSESTVAESRGVRFFALAAPDHCCASAGLTVLLTTNNGPFAITLPCWRGLCELFPDGRAAAAWRLRGAVAGSHRDPDRAFATSSFGILQLTLTFLDF